MPRNPHHKWKHLHKHIPWWSDHRQHVLRWLPGGRQGLLPGNVTWDVYSSDNKMCLRARKPLKAGSEPTAIAAFLGPFLTSLVCSVHLYSILLSFLPLSGWLWWPRGVRRCAAGCGVLGIRLCHEEQARCLHQGVQLQLLDQQHHVLQLNFV